ncbi:MAG TPA: recombinase A [Polyangiaceae bacterium]|nr:recombinase A [Polyangiaceae bacterium]
MSAAHDVEALLQSIRRETDARCRIDSTGDFARKRGPVLELSWPGLGELLPDGGVPRGVVELAAPRALGGATSLALAAVRAGQAGGEDNWCAWIDPEGTLHAPGAVAAGVDLSRLLVVRPPRAQLGRVAVKVMGAGAFEVVVVDFDAVPGASRSLSPSPPSPERKRTWAPEVLVRKLALSAESCGATVLLLTDSTRPRATTWPVALRLELSRPNRDDLVVRVAKDRRGRIGMVKTIPFVPVSPSVASVTSVVPLSTPISAIAG